MDAYACYHRCVKTFLILSFFCSAIIRKENERNEKHAKIVKDFSEQVPIATLKSKHVFIPLSLRLVFSGRISPLFDYSICVLCFGLPFLQTSSHDGSSLFNLPQSSLRYLRCSRDPCVFHASVYVCLVLATARNIVTPPCSYNGT